MTIAFDAVASASGSTIESLSWSHTVGASGATLIVQACAHTGTNPTGDVTASYNGVSMTKIANTELFSAPLYVCQFVLFNPPTGAHTVEIQGYLASSTLEGGSLSWTGVGSVANGTTANATSIAVSSASGHEVVGIGNAVGESGGYGTGNTQQWTQNSFAQGISQSSSGATTTLTTTNSLGGNIMSGVDLVPSTVSPNNGFLSLIDCGT